MASGINVGGTWKDIDSASVNVGGTWKTVSNIHINVGGTWKEAWAAGGSWTPASLFASSEVGAWYDPSDLTTMWTDDGTTQAGVNDLVYRIDDKSGNGYHARQATEAYRPVLRQSGSLYYLEFDGVDDYMATSSNMSVGESTYIVGAAEIREAGGGSSSWSLFGVGASGATGSFISLCRNDVVRRVTANMRAGGGTSYSTPAIESAYTHGATFIFTAYHESNTLYADTNAATGSSAAADDNVDATSRALCINSLSGGAGLPMDWYGGVYVRRVLTSTEKDDAWAWLAAKSGVTL